MPGARALAVRAGKDTLAAECLIRKAEHDARVVQIVTDQHQAWCKYTNG